MLNCPLTDRLPNRIYEDKELPVEEAPRLTTDNCSSAAAGP